MPFRITIRSFEEDRKAKSTAGSSSGSVDLRRTDPDERTSECGEEAECSFALVKLFPCGIIRDLLSSSSIRCHYTRDLIDDKLTGIITISGKLSGLDASVCLGVAFDSLILSSMRLELTKRIISGIGVRTSPFPVRMYLRNSSMNLKADSILRKECAIGMK